MIDTHSIIEQPHERGSALIAVLLLLMMMSALAAALGVSGQTETLISRNQRSGAQAQAAAEAGLNHAMELATTYIFEWKANGFGSAEEAVDALLLGPDQAGGTSATDADNQSLDARAGIDEAEAIPLDTDGTERLAIGVNAEYTAIIMDDDETAPLAVDYAEDGDPLNDMNHTLIVRATGYGPDNTKVVLEALIGRIEMPAVVTNSDLTISGSVNIDGPGGGVHTNADLTVNGTQATVTGTVTASGDYTVPAGSSIVGSGGSSEIPVPPVRASDYEVWADYKLRSDGTMLNVSTGAVCTWSAKTSCNSWNYSSATHGWTLSSNSATNGTYYVQGPATISGSPGSTKTPIRISVIAEGSIDISGSPKLAPDTPELLFVTDQDLKIAGSTDVVGDDLLVQGQMLAHGQVDLGGNASLTGQLIVEDANVGTLVTSNSIHGNVHITYAGGLGSGVYSVTGWRDVR